MSLQERYRAANELYRKSWSDDRYHFLKDRFSKATKNLLTDPTSVVAVATYVAAKAAFEEREREIARLLAEREAIYAEMQR